MSAASSQQCHVIRLGVVPYDVGERRMLELQKQRIAGTVEDTLLLLEHPEIVTAGRRTRRDAANLPAHLLVHEVDRGGGLTWHGPGQLVGYPIFSWTLSGERSVRGAVEKLEAWIIAALDRFAIRGERDSRMHGVWIGGFKIASIGLSFQHWVTRHGFSINLATPPGRVEGFAGCALEAGTTTSIAAATGIAISRTDMEHALFETMASAMGREPTWHSEIPTDSQ